MGGIAAVPTAEMVAGKALESTEAPGGYHGFRQHTAAGMAYIDPQTCHEGVDFL